MQNLQNLISQLESKISQCETTNLAVSGGSVGWHIEHSLKTIDQIVTACKNSNPSDYQWHFNFKRFLIMSIAKKIPRGKARAPKIVRPEGDISTESLTLSLEKVKENLKNWGNLDKNANFPHPFFGILNKKETEKFLLLHTKHHLMIVNDILKS
ncbi:DUF1569 domain-containing protein [Flavobacterium sp. LMO8]|uniref:DUF1569 domain-containing protein n=1 Tax=Flavobacterium sp. LMO8 TaxID=2654244 RepID=UPI0012913927|nr:DUF1569 domain-containing protein [Flavobacterium sp. LMO8]MQP23520.1 DUF1569 domain-containing protein [Flavobacterium sp. LMO8]